ncbi:MAG TPA: tetratricopeptide repeat protein, partial [Rudaea sp.]|nr:tetratricopeptide repeat protein [Rudaea sp.]
MNPFQLELNAALELQRRGELAQAEAAYRALLARYGPHPGVDHMLGLTLHALGRDADALPYFERAETAQPSPALWSNHAAALLAVGRAAEAADRARKAIEAEPRHFGAWLNLGLAREIERRWEEAIGALQTALSLAPQQLVALRALARCRLATGSPDAALHVIAEVTVGRDLATDVIRCQAWADLGNWAAAEALLQTLLATPATRVQALCVQAAIALAQGQRDRALASYRSAAQEDPACRDAFVRAAQIHIGRGETEAGLVLLRNWVERRPSDHAAASNYLFACNYSERFGPAALLEEHRRYRPAPLEAPAWGGDRRPHAPRLRIGWMRNEFGTDLTRIFFADVLHALTEIAPDLDHVLYAVGDPADPASASKRWAADVRDVSRLDDRRLL